MHDDLQEVGAASLEDHQHNRLAQARALRDKLLNRLWAGNGGGVVTTLAAFPKPPHFLELFPLLFFMLGLIVLGIGTCLDLRSARDELRDVEAALERGGQNPILRMHPQFFSKPSRQIWLTAIDWAAIVTFVAGVIAGFGVAFSNVLSPAS